MDLFGNKKRDEAIALLRKNLDATTLALSYLQDKVRPPRKFEIGDKVQAKFYVSLGYSMKTGYKNAVVVAVRKDGVDWGYDVASLCGVYSLTMERAGTLSRIEDTPKPKTKKKEK